MRKILTLALLAASPLAAATQNAKSIRLVMPTGNGSILIDTTGGWNANTLKGESLPDPTKDDSILKLQKDKAFWTFVQSLPKR